MFSWVDLSFYLNKDQDTFHSMLMLFREKIQKA